MSTSSERSELRGARAWQDLFELCKGEWRELERGKGGKDLHPQASISWFQGKRGIQQGRLRVRLMRRRERKYPIGCLRTLGLLP